MAPIGRILRIVFLFFSLFAFSAEAGNVIFVTVDGVRFEEFFRGVRFYRRSDFPRNTPTFPELWKSIRKGEAVVFGTRKHHGKMRVGNPVGMSLPGYRSLLSGEYEDRCRTNRCPNIDRQTIFDSLADLGWPKESVGAFASWNGLNNALESRPGGIARSVEFDGFPDVQLSDEQRAEIEAVVARARTDLPIWPGSRKDKYTYDLGMRYLDQVRPRFLYLSFVDSDEYAHREMYRKYINSLREYDSWIVKIREKLAAMGEYGDDTSIVITTDHGRLPWLLWGRHGDGLLGSMRTWAVVIPSAKIRREKKVSAREASKYSQVDLRPTLELLLGVDHRGQAQGSPLVELR